MSLICKVLLWSVMISFLAAGAKAEAIQAEPWRGILCDTAEQAEAVVTKGQELGGALQGIQAVNLEHGADTCIVGLVLGVRGPPMKTIDSPDGMLDVVGITIYGVFTLQGLQPAKVPTLWYTLQGSVRQGV